MSGVTADSSAFWFLVISRATSWLARAACSWVSSELPCENWPPVKRPTMEMPRQRVETASTSHRKRWTKRPQALNMRCFLVLSYGVLMAALCRSHDHSRKRVHGRLRVQFGIHQRLQADAPDAGPDGGGDGRSVIRAAVLPL